MKQKKSNTVFIICCTGIFSVLFCLMPMWVFAAEVKLVKLDREKNKIKLTLESDRPISYQFELVEATSKFTIGLQGADYYLALTEFFKNFDLDSLSQCLDEIAIVPVSNDEATIEVILGEGMNGSVYDDTANSPKNFRIIIQFVALNKSDAPCFSGSSVTPSLPENTAPLDLSKIKQQRESGLSNEDIRLAEQPETNTQMKVAEENATDTQMPSKHAKFYLSGFVLGDYLQIKKNKSNNDGLLHEAKTELRAAQLSVDGNMGAWNYNLALRLQPNLQNESTTTLHRASMAFEPWSAWRLHLGLMPEPFGGEQASESNNLLFLERSLASTLSPTRNPGVLVSYDKGGLTNWSLGLFGERPSSDDPTSEQSMTTKLGFEPYRNKNQTLSINLAFSQWKPKDSIVAFNVNPESHLILPLFNVEQTDVDSVNTIGISALSSYNQLMVILESTNSNLTLIDQSNSDAKVQSVGGQSLSIGWLFTGERRQIRQGILQPVMPLRPLGSGKGWGALEVGVRYSRLYDDQDQTLTDISYGATWYLSQYYQIKANWVFSSYESPSLSLDAEIAEIRLQFTY